MAGGGDDPAVLSNFVCPLGIAEELAAGGAGIILAVAGLGAGGCLGLGLSQVVAGGGGGKVLGCGTAICAVERTVGVDTEEAAAVGTGVIGLAAASGTGGGHGVGLHRVLMGQRSQDEVLGAVVLVGLVDGAVGVGTEELAAVVAAEVQGAAGVFTIGGSGGVSRGTAMIQLGQGEVRSAVVDSGGIQLAIGGDGEELVAVGAGVVGFVAVCGTGGGSGLMLGGVYMVIGVDVRQLIAAGGTPGRRGAGGGGAGVILVGRLCAAAAALADLPVAGAIALVGLALVVMAQGGQLESIVAVVGGGRIQLAVLVGKVAAAVAAVPIGLIAAHLAGRSHGIGLHRVLVVQGRDVEGAGIVIQGGVAILAAEELAAVGAGVVLAVTLDGAGGSGGLVLGGAYMVVGINVCQLIAAGGAPGRSGAGGGGAGVILVGRLCAAAAALADLPVAGAIALVGLALVVMAQGGQLESIVAVVGGGSIQLAVLIGKVAAAVIAVPIGLIAAHGAGDCHSISLDGVLMGQGRDVEAADIAIEVCIIVLEIFSAVCAMLIGLMALAAAGGRLIIDRSDLVGGVVVNIKLAVLGIANGTHSLGGAGGGGVGHVIFPLLSSAAGHGAGVVVLGVVMLPSTPDVLGGMLDGEGPGIRREAVRPGGGEVPLTGDDQIHLIGAGIGGACHHIASLLIHQGGVAAAQGVAGVHGDGRGFGCAVPDQILGGGEGEVLGQGRFPADEPGNGVALGGGAPLVSVLLQCHSRLVAACVGGFGNAADGVALAGHKEGVLGAVVEEDGHCGTGEDNGL